jgi:hypothetical protein
MFNPRCSRKKRTGEIREKNAEASVTEQRSRQQRRPVVHAVKHHSTLRTNTDVSVRSAEKCTLAWNEVRKRNCSSWSVRELNVGRRTCLRPKEARKRKNLQFALHAHACSLRCTLGAIRSGTRYAKWAGGSRSQTHRRAAMGGFTQDDGYVRGVAPTHDCSSGSFSNLCNLWRLWPVLELST